MEPSIEKCKLEILVIADALVWITVIGNIQLALKHPENDGPSASLMREFCERLIRKLLAEGVFTPEYAARVFEDFYR